MVYGLGPEGAGMLYARGEQARIDWTAKNRSSTKLFIEHTLRVADFMVALEVACRAANIELTRAEKLPEYPRWSVSVSHQGTRATLGVVPDAVFSLTTANNATVFYCLEADRGTMPVKRRHLYQTSAYRKFLAYQASWKQRVTEKRFGWKRFRVLTLTASAERVKRLREVASELPSGHGLFLFADQHQLSQSPDVLALPWTPAGNNRVVTLAP